MRRWYPRAAALRHEPSRGEARGCAVGGGDPREPRRLASERSPGARIEEGRREEANCVHERERLAQPAGERDDLAWDEPEEDDREHDQDCDERGGASLAGEAADRC